MTDQEEGITRMCLSLETNTCIAGKKWILICTQTNLAMEMNAFHAGGINACDKFLNTKTDQSPPTNNLCHLIQLILDSNRFIFNAAYYLQLQGTAIGTRMAPLYTN